MPLYPYTIRYEQDSPFQAVDLMPRVEANSAEDAVNRLWDGGRLPKYGPLYHVCLVTETHDNGVPFKVLAVPVEPARSPLAGR
jgi:hypothetical protein